MKLLLLPLLVLLLSCSSAPAQAKEYRFKLVYVEYPDWATAVRVVYDSWGEACFVYASSGYGAGMAEAPMAVCRATPPTR